jgi:hypothetical protein
MLINLITTYGIFIYALLVLFVVLVFGLKIFKHIKRVHYLNNFTTYRAILDYHMEKAYDMIHKEHILAYSLDAYRIEEKDYARISKEFVKLVVKIIGPVIAKELVNLYGDETTFSFNLLDYFSTRYENDEIRNTALEQITEKEVDEQ